MRALASAVEGLYSRILEAQLAEEMEREAVDACQGRQREGRTSHADRNDLGAAQGSGADPGNRRLGRHRPHPPGGAGPDYF